MLEWGLGRVLFKGVLVGYGERVVRGWGVGGVKLIVRGTRKRW